MSTILLFYFVRMGILTVECVPYEALYCLFFFVVGTVLSVFLPGYAVVAKQN